MPDRETWEFINTFAPWLAALGTFAAVVTSLYLALKRDIDVKVTAGLRTLIMEGEHPGPRQDYVSVEISNRSPRPITITAVVWKTGIFRKNTFFWVVPRNTLSNTIPVKLGDGEQARFISPLNEWEPNFNNVAETISGWLSELNSRFIRIGVTTSTGDLFENRVEESLRAHILKMARKAASVSADGD